MDKKTIFTAAAILLVVLIFAWQAPAQKDGPAPQRGPGIGGPIPDPDPPGTGPVNVILIIADDVGVDQVGIYEEGYEDSPHQSMEHPEPCTPVLDDLARYGVRFTNAWSNPLCTPTRSQIMTGKRTFVTGLGSVTNPLQPERAGLDEDYVTLGDFRDEDAAVGKWHLADELQKPDHPTQGLGFEHFLGVFYNLSVCQEGPTYYDWWQWDGVHTYPFHKTQYATVVTTDDAIDFVDDFEDDPEDNPWFLYVSYNAAHAPFHCPDESDWPPSHDLCDPDWCEDCGTGGGIEDYSDTIKKTRAMVHVMDYQIGQLLQYVDQNVSDPTVVIFIGDNGTPSGINFNAVHAPFRTFRAKSTVYQGGINVPLIIYDPRVQRDPQNPTVCHELVSATDLFATVAEFLGESYTETGHDSKSLASYVNEEYPGREDREYVYSELFVPNFRPKLGGGPPSGFVAESHKRAIRNTTHKLIEVQSETGVTREFYRLYDENLGLPAPQDPAWFDDPSATHPWVSAFEDSNLLDILEWRWDALDNAAFASLETELAANYPTFTSFGTPVYDFEQITPEFVRCATRYGTNSTADCSDQLIHVRYTEDGPYNWTARAFLEFDVSSFDADPEDIESVELDVAVISGGTWYTDIEVRPITGYVSGYGTDPYDCYDLFDSPEATVYANVGDWIFPRPDTKIIRLNATALADLRTAMGQSYPGNRFSIALKLEKEESAFADDVELYYAGGSTCNSHHLRIRLASGESVPLDLTSGSGHEPQQKHDNALKNSYPNPFNPTTTIEYSLKKRSHVLLEIFNVAGQLVRTMVDEIQGPGDDYRVVWDGRNNAGETVTSGVYFYRLKAGDFLETRKTILLK